MLGFWFLFYFLTDRLPTIQFCFYLFCQDCPVFLYDRRFVINVTVAVRDNSTLSEILQRPCIRTFLHVQQLLQVPLIKIRRLYKRVYHTVLSVISCTIDTKMHSQMYGRPFGVLFLTIDTNLHYLMLTLLSFWCLIAAKILSRTSSSTS